MIVLLLFVINIVLLLVVVTGKFNFKRKLIIVSIWIVISWPLAIILGIREESIFMGALMGGILIGTPIAALGSIVQPKIDEKMQKNAAIRERQQMIAIEKAKEKEKERRRNLKREVRREVLGIDDEERRERIPQNVQDKVWIRDGGRCVFCGSNRDLEFDHIIPFSKGGANTYRNIQLLCQKCNREKSDRIG